MREVSPLVGPGSHRLARRATSASRIGSRHIDRVSGCAASSINRGAVRWCAAARQESSLFATFLVSSTSHSLLSSMRRHYSASAVIAPHSHRRFHTMIPLSSLTNAIRCFHCTFHDPITPELITIEPIDADDHVTTSAAARVVVVVGDDGATSASAATTATEGVATAAKHHQRITTHTPHHHNTPPSSAAAGGGGGSSSSCGSSLFTDVTSIDNFVKGKVVNFLRRMGVTQSTIFTVQREPLEGGCEGERGSNNNGGGPTLYRARVPLKLPSPHDGMFVAEGIGESAKDAESLAAMHAQHIVDALGIPLFALSSMQIKHAEAAKKAGRYAPMPGDDVRPVGTPVPSPFRMIQLDYTQQVTAAAAAATASASVAASSVVGGPSAANANPNALFRGIMEAEVVGSRGAAASTTRDTKADDVSADRSADGPCAAAHRHPYSDTCHFPWLASSANSGGGVAPHDVSTTAHGGSHGKKTAGGAAATPRTHQPLFDPTENGMFSMVNVNSMRMSPSPDAILFPCVYDKGAMERLKDYFIAHGLDAKKQFHVSHVAVAGYSVRMYVAECRLAPGVHVIARGKAQDKDCAQHLAAMHAELLVDALGLRLFPSDDARQAKHADAVRGFGRWALQPGCVEGVASVPPPLRDAPLPLPLKQQVGGDEVWLDAVPFAARRQQHRTFGERVIMAHHELNGIINELVEVNPPQAMLTEARHLIQSWQRDVAHNTSLPDAYLVIKMGEYYRASTLLPVPKAFGVRGGVGIGRSIEQAMDLAALHAVDTLCALGIPLFADAAREAAFLAERDAMGLLAKRHHGVVADASGGRQGPSPAVVGGMGSDDGGGGGNTAEGASPLQSTLVTDVGETHSNGEVLHHEDANSQRSDPTAVDDDAGLTRGSVASPAALTAALRSRGGYLPGYIIEGSHERMPPQIDDLLYALSLDPKTDFACVTTTMTAASPASTTAAAPASTATTTDECIIAMGNECRSNLQLYLQRVAKHAPLGSTATATASGGGGGLETHVFITGYASNQSVYNIAFLHIPLLTDANAATMATTKAARSSTISTTPLRRRGGLIAVGLSLKKKDAERMCFVHASQLLQAHGVDIARERDLLFAEKQKRHGPPPPPATSSGGITSTVVAPADNTILENADAPTRRTLPSPVVHPAYLRLVAAAGASTPSANHHRPPQQRRGR